MNFNSRGIISYQMFVQRFWRRFSNEKDLWIKNISTWSISWGCTNQLYLYLFVCQSLCRWGIWNGNLVYKIICSVCCRPLKWCRSRHHIIWWHIRSSSRSFVLHYILKFSILSFFGSGQVSEGWCGQNHFI